MTPISALSPEELNDTLSLRPAFRGRQLFHWIHRRLVFDPALMTDLPADLRDGLAGRIRCLTLDIADCRRDEDGTVKYGLRLDDGRVIETVLLTDLRGRRTACLSTQAGCGMNCRFCRTARLGLGRNLTASEIVEQLLLLRSRHGEIANVVFMGMGEPLANLEALRRAVGVLTFPEGTAMSLRRLTLSTCGLIDGILDLAAGGPHLRLALSLLTADQELRAELMPAARINRLPELRRALQTYQAATGKRITLELVLLAGVNDGRKDVEAVRRFVEGERGGAGLRVLANLIPYNHVDGLPYAPSPAARVESFRRRLLEAGIPASTRLPRGPGIGGACGQLGGLAQDRPDAAHSRR
jgi:23S rRNA (adenine2503-C2)-methyltransferase